MFSWLTWSCGSQPLPNIRRVLYCIQLAQECFYQMCPAFTGWVRDCLYYDFTVSWYLEVTGFLSSTNFPIFSCKMVLATCSSASYLWFSNQFVIFHGNLWRDFISLLLWINLEKIDICYVKLSHPWTWFIALFGYFYLITFNKVLLFLFSKVTHIFLWVSFILLL